MTHGVDPARFTTPFPEYLRCARCKYVALPPRVICADEHLLCVPCLGDAREENPFPTCPSCRKRIRKNAPASCILERAIDSFMYTCKRSDCDWTGSIYDYSPHVRDECLFRPIPCRVCDHAVRFKDEADHIQKRCPLAVVKCPRRLCSSGGEIPRNEFAAHEKVCSMERCVVAGCPTRTTKANMPAHEAACMANVKLVERLKDEVRRLNKNIRERQDDEELLSEDDEWVDEDEEEEERYEEYEDEDDEESMDAVYTRLDKTLDDTIAWAAATKARQTPLAPIAAPAPTSSTSRTATAPFAQAPPYLARARRQPRVDFGEQQQQQPLGGQAVQGARCRPRGGDGRDGRALRRARGPSRRSVLGAVGRPCSSWWVCATRVVLVDLLSSSTFSNSALVAELALDSPSPAQGSPGLSRVSQTARRAV